jgi:hypothetical protein
MWWPGVASTIQKGATTGTTLSSTRKDQILKEKKHGLGYEVYMASAEYMDMIEASPQMEDGNQPIVDDME